MAFSQTIDYGKTYVNKTKGSSGGTIEPKDVLQIRTTIVVSSTTPTIDSCAFYDTIPTGATYVANSMKIITNEGKVYKSFTDAADNDPAKIMSSKYITVHMGYGTNASKTATASRRGQIKNTDKPTLWGSICVMVVSYEIVINSNYGSTLDVGGGRFTYKYNNKFVNIDFGKDNIAVFKNTGICENTVGGNAVGMEFNGTFGSGKSRNRGASAAISGTYQFKTFTTGTPDDYYYGVANNTSTQNYTTSNAWTKPDNTSISHRVFSVWDIIGDHTGAADPFAGNKAADTVANANAGYMMVVNASYKTDYAFQYMVTNLCPNTYYEISSWLYNICSKCGADSMGRGPGNSGYIPTGPGDSSGVHPNLTYQLNGIDYYTTGDIPYTGKWVKKGFTYLTGPNQSSFTLTIRNNAPGGGGNDWAIDDISVATCTPNLDMQPSGNARVCYNNQIDISTVVSSFYPNFTYWRWEKSKDGGSSWSIDSTGMGAVQNVGGKYEYRVDHKPFLADSSVNGNMYRIRIATSAENLSNDNCSVAASTTLMVYVNNCSTILNTSLLNFEGQLSNVNYALLRWTSGSEAANTKFILEKSFDNIHYKQLAIVDGKATAGIGAAYGFSDPEELRGTVYYRVRIQDGAEFIYSKSIVLNPEGLAFDVQNVQNPFKQNITFHAIAPNDGAIKMLLYDSRGRLVKTDAAKVSKGLTNIAITGLDNLSSGVYALQVVYKNFTIVKRVIKMAM